LAIPGFVFSGRDGVPHSGVVNVKQISYAYDDATQQVTLSGKTDIAQTPGADGIFLAPGQTDLIVGGAINGEVHKIRISDGLTETAMIPGTDSFHLALDPSGTHIWTTEMPGLTLGEVSLNFGSSIEVHVVTGDPITQLAFANGQAYYTSSMREGEGFFGILDMSTFTTTRVNLTGDINDNIEYTHSIMFDPFTGDLLLFGDSMIGQIDISDPLNPVLKSQLDVSAAVVTICPK